MTFHEDLGELKEQIDRMVSIRQLQKFLIQKGLDLSISLSTTGFSSVEWSISLGNLRGVLMLGMHLKLTKISDENTIAETRHTEPFQFDRGTPLNKKELLKMLKRGMKTCTEKSFLFPSVSIEEKASNTSCYRFK
jgi:hypothetical protein